MVLSADEVPVNINDPANPAVVSVVNNPTDMKVRTLLGTAFILHTTTRQMSVRGRKASFILMEEAPTIRLVNMHRIPATLRRFNIATVYVMQDKIRNELLYGKKQARRFLAICLTSFRKGK